MELHSDQTSPEYGRRRQRWIFVQGLGRIVPRVPADFSALEERARRAMTKRGFAYVAGAAGNERTMVANRAAFDRWRIVPRMLRDVSRRDLSLTLFGKRLPTPLILAPIGVLEMAHSHADLAVARAAAAERVPFIFSNQASVPMETCAAAMGDEIHWFQLYWSTDDRLVISFLRRAEACGCGAIVVTLDTPLLGWRSRDLDLGSLPFLQGMGIAQYTSDPVFCEGLTQTQSEPTPDFVKPPNNLFSFRARWNQIRRHPGSLLRNLLSAAPIAAVPKFLNSYSRASLTWKDLAWLRQQTRLPILLKGLLSAEDARLAIEHEVDGIIVSNHGGRQVDGAIAAIDALPQVVKVANGRLPVLFDSGIRSGADMFKALTLGASAICLGRPYVYGLAIAGEHGVRELIQNILAEFDLTMALTGCATLADVANAALERVA
ncbi:MAG: alpha-hydroxy-acid oxidizing protein [Verrucomicrobia bacterium]|nr:alpha-hydroxy-acid oxidizing protein [Verrucomicrobiota bacterium]